MVIFGADSVAHSRLTHSLTYARIHANTLARRFRGYKLYGIEKSRPSSALIKRVAFRSRTSLMAILLLIMCTPAAAAGGCDVDIILPEERTRSDKDASVVVAK